MDSIEEVVREADVVDIVDEAEDVVVAVGIKSVRMAHNICLNT